MKANHIATVTASQIFVFKGLELTIQGSQFEIIDKLIEVTDPIYKQKHLFNIWIYIFEGNRYEFAIGEFSNGIFGVYLVEYFLII